MFRALSTLLSRVSWRLGSTFGGRRDMYTVLGYQRGDIESEKYRFRYERGDIAGRIVDAFPEDTWSPPDENVGALIEDPDPNTTTPFEAAWDTLQNRLGVWSVFQRADILAQLGRYSVILIGAPGKADEELGTVAAENILYLMAYGEENATFSEQDLELDSQNPRFGLPNFYNIKVSASGVKIIETRFHWSRVIHIVDGMLDHRLYGIPRLKSVWNRLDDLEKIVGGGSESFWQRANKGTLFNIDKDMVLPDDDSPDGENAELKAMKEQVKEFGDGMRRTMTLRGVEVTDLGAEVADFASPAACVISVIAGAKSIPQRLLLGSERGELASTQDRQNWADRIKNRRRDYALPMVVRPFVDRLIAAGALPTPTMYVVNWPDVFSLSEPEKMALASQAAGINGRMGDVVILAEEVRTKYLGLPAFTDEQEAEIEQEIEEEQEREDELLDKQAKAKQPPPRR